MGDGAGDLEHGSRGKPLAKRAGGWCRSSAELLRAQYGDANIASLQGFNVGVVARTGGRQRRACAFWWHFFASALPNDGRVASDQ